MRLPAALAGLQAALGSVVMARPDDASRIAAGPGRRPPESVVRILGLRMLAQAAAVAAAQRLRRDVRTVLLLGVAVDALHAASMVLAAGWKPAYRRAALTSAGVAAVSAGAGVVAAGEVGG